MALALGAVLALAHATTPDAHAAFAATRVPMCRAVIQEMYTEIHKHSLRKNGEDDIYETVPAICLAIVQNYTLTPTKPPKRDWVLRKRTTRLDDEEGGPDPSAIEHLLTLKQVCELFTDEFQQELSELMYRAVNEREPKAIEAEFCGSAAVTTAPPPPPPPRKRTAKPSGSSSGGGGGGGGGGEGKKKTKKKAKGGGGAGDDAPPDMADLLKKYDTDGSISNLLEMERENPEAMLEADDLATVEQGASEIRCDVCGAVAKVALSRAKKAKALRDEERLSGLTNLLCYGSDPNDLDTYPKYPGNPPLWAEMYSVGKAERDGGGSGGSGGEKDAAAAACFGCGKGPWRMRRKPKGAMPDERNMGGGGGEGGGMDYNSLVMKHAMISRACRTVVLSPEDVLEEDEADEHPDLAQTIFQHPQESGAQLAQRYCMPFCRRSGSGSAAAATSGKEEL